MRMPDVHPHLNRHRSRRLQAFCRRGGWSPAAFSLPSPLSTRRAGRGLPR